MTTRQPNPMTTTLVGERELVLTRAFDAPRELVFRAYSEPELLRAWWGPEGWQTEILRFEFRPGGVWHYVMRGPENMESWGIARFRAIAAPERFAYTDAFSDADANTLSPEMEIVNVFEALTPTRTLLTSRTTFDSRESRDQAIEMGVEQGTSSMFDRLEQYLADLAAQR